jgi:hypothetical protein
MAGKQQLTQSQRATLLDTLEERFRQNVHRHPDIDWEKVAARLAKAPPKLRSLHEMEQSGGEPDVIGREANSGEYVFVDCSAESPAGRRSVCYDREALESRKEHKPKDSATSMAASMGIDLLTEAQYRELQAIESVDNKTSSWVQTPAGIRKLGGALFCDRRYDHVFTYHNGAQSYYAARGFRGCLRV